MLKRFLLLFSATLFVLITCALALLSGSQLATVINWGLPKEWSVQTEEGTSLSWQGIALPKFILNYQSCSLLYLDQTRLTWQDVLHLKADKVVIDYHCVQQLPETESDDDSTFSLNVWLSLIPKGEISIDSLSFLNLPSTWSPRWHSLLTDSSRLHFTYSSEKITAYLAHLQANIHAELHNGQLNAEISYFPTGAEQHLISLNSEIDSANLFNIPQKSQIHYQWQLPDDIISGKEWQKGIADIHWQNKEDRFMGNLSLQFPNEPKNYLNFPFSFDFNTLVIEQGQFHWEMLPTFPLKGFVNARLTPKNVSNNEWLPLDSYLRFSLLSQNEYGKGNIVIENQNGEWQADRLTLPLRLTGNIKYGNFVLYSSVPLDIQGAYQDLTLRFLPSSLLRMTGSERFLTIKDLRFPLAGISISNKGIRGRLQAIFKGETPDFKDIELHLDGFAQNFKAGLLDLFETDKTLEKKLQDRWNWRFWGNAYSTGAKTRLNVNGRGHWHKKQIELSEFQGNLGKIKQYALQIPRIDLKLTMPIRYAYASDHLQGGIQMQADHLYFDYGGELPNLTAKLNFNGNVENLKFNGEVKSTDIGPLKLFARRHLAKNASSSEFIGRLYWQEQPAKVFQPLFPFRQNWVVTGGIIRGETAFNFNADKGITAGGHFAVRNGAMSLPSGDIVGIDFSLPYRLNNDRFIFGIKQPLAVQIDQIQLGTLALNNVKMKVNGHYPYSKKRPLNLSQLSFNLLGGELRIERFALPQQKIAYLKLQGIELEKVLELAQYQQIDLKGKVDATLPFWLSGTPCYVCDGIFSQQGKSSLKFTPELIKAMKQSGYTEQILMYLVNHSQLNELSGMINVGSKGDMVLDSKIRTALVEHQKTKINLNYNHKENLFDLWHLINYSSQFEQQIENQLYQKLDKTK